MENKKLVYYLFFLDEKLKTFSSEDIKNNISREDKLNGNHNDCENVCPVM